MVIIFVMSENYNLKDRFKAYKDHSRAKEWLNNNIDRLKKIFTDIKIRDYIFEPFMTHHNFTEMIFHRGYHCILTTEKTLHLISKRSIRKIGFDISCWGKINASLKTCNLVAEIQNEHNCWISCPLAHIIVGSTTHEDYCRYFSSLRELFFEKNRQRADNANYNL